LRNKSGNHENEYCYPSKMRVWSTNFKKAQNSNSVASGNSRQCRQRKAERPKENRTEQCSRSQRREQFKKERWSNAMDMLPLRLPASSSKQSTEEDKQKPNTFLLG
jgi:hypothetical protein